MCKLCRTTGKKGWERIRLTTKSTKSAKNALNVPSFVAFGFFVVKNSFPSEVAKLVRKSEKCEKLVFATFGLELVVAQVFPTKTDGGHFSDFSKTFRGYTGGRGLFQWGVGSAECRVGATNAVVLLPSPRLWRDWRMAKVKTFENSGNRLFLAGLRGGDLFAVQYPNGRATLCRAVTFNRFRVRLSLTLPVLLIKGLIGHEIIQVNRA
jgi:hypothetical protein